MLPIQMECEFRMIHCGRFPASGRMTCSALGTKLTLMEIILFMTRETILRRSFEDAILMAAFTGDGGMFTIQMERKLGMIYLRKTPAFGRMAGCAVDSKLTVMMIIFLMTGDTRQWSRFQILKRARVDMADRTFQWSMFSDQIERHLVMIE